MPKSDFRETLVYFFRNLKFYVLKSIFSCAFLNQILPIFSAYDIRLRRHYCACIFKYDVFSFFLQLFITNFKK
jgi:hypothetical protein